MRTFIKSLNLLSILSVFVFNTNGQENEFIPKLKTQLLLYRTQKIDQSITLLTDKTFYRPGETIWLKSYLTDDLTHLLSLKSHEMSLLLTDNKGIAIIETKLLLKNGIAEYRLPIPGDLRSNIYYLVAFTPEMEGMGVSEALVKKVAIGRPEYFDLLPKLELSKPFFAPEQKETVQLKLSNLAGQPVTSKKFEYQIITNGKEILSGKGKTDSNGSGEIVFITPSQKSGQAMLVSVDINSGGDRLNLVNKIPLSAEKLNVIFYPEGGNLVPGIPQTVVYEVKDQLGNPTTMKGEIVDEQNKVVASTTTILPGLGVFTVQNDEHILKLRILSDIGKGQEINLPAQVAGSMTVSMKKNDSKNISLLLGRSPKSPKEKFTIVAISNGEMTWASDFDLDQAGLINVPLENFTEPIAMIGVFNSAGMLVGQRLVYTGKEKVMNFTINPNKTTYKSGEEGEFLVKIVDSEGKPLKSEVTIALSDKLSLPISANEIRLINNGLSKPLPFRESIEKVSKIALDYFLVTNSLKGLDLMEVLSIDPTKTLNLNKLQTRVTGRVIDNKDLPVPNALINLTNPSMQQFKAHSNERGEFAINLPTGVDGKNITASATDESGKGNFRVILNMNFKEELTASLNRDKETNWDNVDQLSQMGYFKSNPDFLKATPPVKFRNDEKSREPYWKKYLTSSTNLLEIIKTMRSYELTGGKIIFRGSNSFYYQDGALIVVDGVKMGTDASQLNIINPNDVDDIQILLNPVDMSNYTSLNAVGVIVIKTKRGLASAVTSIDNSKPVVKESENFKPQAIGYDKYDLKTTLQWLPSVFTNDNGEVRIPFKTGAIKSNFVLDIAGYTDQGQWFGKQIEIKVE